MEPVPAPETQPVQSYMELYDQVLALPDGEAVPVKFETKKKAKSFFSNVLGTGRAGWKRGIGGTRRGRIVYLYRRNGGKPTID